jgi:formamidopyrimidine-DNA glycosylase
MPELPEVETVRRGLIAPLENHILTRVEVRRPDLRRPLPPDMAARLTGRRVTAVRRRAKYLLADLDDGQVLLLHLGMSGRITLSYGRPNALEKHDHLVFESSSGWVLRFNDARRFGMADLMRAEEQADHPMLRDLGPEPLSDAFSGSVLAAGLAGRISPVKVVLLDQTLVAGIGNIYASEALFRAGIHPARAARSLSPADCDRLAAAVRSVLTRAIEAGGSSLRDHVQPNGELGYFQHEWTVYGRDGEACRTCGSPLEKMTQAARSTFFCSRCQS